MQKVKLIRVFEQVLRSVPSPKHLIMVYTIYYTLDTDAPNGFFKRNYWFRFSGSGSGHHYMAQVASVLVPRNPEEAFPDISTVRLTLYEPSPFISNQLSARRDKDGRLYSKKNKKYTFFTKTDESTREPDQVINYIQDHADNLVELHRQYTDNIRRIKELVQELQE